MLIVIAVLFTLLTALAILALSFTRLRPGYLWLLAVASSFVAWILVIASRGILPLVIPLADWQTDVLFQASPSLLIDQVSWPYAVAVMTLPLAALLTEVISLRDLDPQTWASILALGAVGLIAVVAGNPLTLLLTWTVTDLAESVVLLMLMQTSQARERVVVAFSVRVLGMFFLILTMLQASSMGVALTFQSIPSGLGGGLLMAAGLRLGVLPPHQPYMGEPFLRRGIATLVRLAPAAASLVLLVRVAAVGIIGFWLPVVMILAALSAFSGAVAWLRAKNELQGLPFWILVFGAFVLASSAQGLSVASSAWGLALIFSGALIFLFSIRQRWLLVVLIVGLVGFSALPWTPTWEGTALFGALPWGYRLVFFVALALLFIGYFQHAQRSVVFERGIERWMWLVYPSGLILVPLTHFVLVYSGWIAGFREMSFRSPGWWNGLIPLGVVAIFLVWSHREPVTVPPFISGIGELVNLNWVYRFFWQIYRSFSRFSDIVTRLLEGEGGVLWALVILIMLVVSISLQSLGGRFEF